MEKERDEKGYRHVLKYTSLFGGVQGLTIFINLVRNKAMALLIGADGMGLASIMLSMQNFASQCTNLGISFGAVPRLSSYYEQGNQLRLEYYVMLIRLWSFIAAVLGLLFCLAVSPFLTIFTFSWGDFSLHYAVLGFSVAMLAITGGEMAILKATRRLGMLVRIQVFTTLASLVISLPLYYFFRYSGVVPAIVLISFASMLATIFYSYRCFPLRFSFRKSLLSEGSGMIKLGLAYVLAAAIGSASEMFIRSYLNIEGNLNTVGLYNAAYMLTITYAGMVFSSMDTDYYPRLSAVAKDIAATNETVNKQMEVSLLLLSPMLVTLLMVMPVLVPLLLSNEFLPMVAMAQVSILAMYFKSLSMPVAFISLARSRSLAYLFLETSYYVAFVLAIIVGYQQWGIFGTGIAIVVAHVCEYIFIWSFAYWQYGYRTTGSMARYALVQLTIGTIAFAVSQWLEGWIYWIIEAALVVTSTAFSLNILRQKTHLWESLKRKFHLG